MSEILTKASTWNENMYPPEWASTFYTLPEITSKKMYDSIYPVVV
jgi:hypothetical protein